MSLPLHTLVTATATDAENETSMFSVRLAVGDYSGNTFVVNSTADDDEGWADPAHLTLREAILEANNHPGLDTIDFDIGSGGVQTIAPAKNLPDIEDPVTIDGSSQPGFAGTPLIVLSGATMVQRRLAGLGYDLTGLQVHGNNVTIRGLNINGFFYYFVTKFDLVDGGWPVHIFGDNNVLAGNFIGTDPTGTTDVPNLNGPNVSGNNNRIGGTTPADRNLLSGNAFGDLGVEGTGNVVEGNYVGTDVTGTRPLFNGLYFTTNISYEFVNGAGTGVYVSGQATVGGSAAGAGNLIAGLTWTDLALSQAGGSVVEGNIIGLDATGSKLIPNYSGDGIDVTDYYYDSTLEGVTIGGPLPGEGNIISGNSIGIYLATDNNTVQGNYIGTDITGLVAIGNYVDGVRIEGNNNLIGGAGLGDGNVISGNRNMGVRLDNGVTGNLVQGNLIGVGVDGITPLGNVTDGVGIANPYSFEAYPYGNLIGGLDPGDGNVIAYNRSGVDVYSGVQDEILSNSIFNNVGLGIDLGLDGVTPNDPGDADTGNNNLQNFPLISSAVSDGSHTTVSGTFNSTPSSYFMLQFFQNDTGDPSGYGEGQTLLGTRYLKTDSSGNASFIFTFSSGVASGQIITATATDSQNNTSEFSAGYQVGQWHGGGEPAAGFRPGRALHDQRGRFAAVGRFALFRSGRRSAHVHVGH